MVTKPPVETVKAKQQPVEPTNSTKRHVNPVTPKSKPTSNAVLIRGRPSSTATPLFLIADGAGSATAYIHIPELATGNRIYAIESPFLQNPAAYNCTVEEVCTIYLAAICRVSPNGPYLIGGWSAGAVYAYEVARQLLYNHNQQVQGLILVDMRVPRRMSDAMEPSKELLESAGIFKGIERDGRLASAFSERLKQHLVRTVAALINYDPVPMEKGRRPANNFVIWAQKGLSETRDRTPLGKSKEANEAPGELDELQESWWGGKNGENGANAMDQQETGLKSWFCDKRSAFGPNGWDKMVGEIECHVIEDADHFEIVVPPKVKDLGKIISHAVKKCLAKAQN